MVDQFKGSSLQLSAFELRNLTKWPDPVIQEFLSLQAGVQNITENINIVINNIDLVMGAGSQTLSWINQLRGTIALLQEQAAATDSLVSKIAANKRDSLRVINDLAEQLSSVQAVNSRLYAKITANTDSLLNLQEEMNGN